MPGGDELPEELADPAKRLDAIERAMAALEQQATEKAEQKGKEPSKPKDNAQYNFTDPDSRIMKSADRAYIQAYNAQAAVDEQHQIVVAAEVTQQANDKGWLAANFTVPSTLICRRALLPLRQWE